MSTGRQVDHLVWAIAEARRQRAEDQDRRLVESEVRPQGSYRVGDGFVTEWQSADVVSLSL